MPPIRVLIADDHPRVREGLRLAIEDEVGVALVGEAVDGRDLAAQFAEHRPDVVVTDLGMPHFDLPQQQIAAWRAAYPTMKILVHTAYKSAALARLLLDVGADGYVVKEGGGETLISAIRAVAGGETWGTRAQLGNVPGSSRGGDSFRETPLA